METMKFYSNNRDFLEGVAVGIDLSAPENVDIALITESDIEGYMYMLPVTEASDTDPTTLRIFFDNTEQTHIEVV